MASLFKRVSVFDSNFEESKSEQYGEADSDNSDIGRNQNVYLERENRKINYQGFSDIGSDPVCNSKSADENVIEDYSGRMTTMPCHVKEKCNFVYRTNIIN